MKLQERRIHEEEHTSGHLMLLFQTVMQLFSMAGKTMRESGHVSTNVILQPVLLYQSLWIQDVCTHLLEW